MCFIIRKKKDSPTESSLLDKANFIYYAYISLKYKEIIRQSQQKLFYYFQRLLYLATCFGQLGHFQVIHTVYEMPGREFETQNAIERLEISFFFT